MKKVFAIILCVSVIQVFAQEKPKKNDDTYKKRVLESTEVDFFLNYYTQDGDNAAVTGGKGTEELSDIAPKFVVAIPINADDILTIDAGISAYTSASSGNIDPFDNDEEADPFVAGTGASTSDVWVNAVVSYSHSSDDRNSIWSGKVSFSNEYDYTSVGVGGSYTKLFNEKNTEVSANANVFIDTWKLLYPMELRPFGDNGEGLSHNFFSGYNITGNPNYAPRFSKLDGQGRYSYSLGLGFSQILSKRLQGSLSADLILQNGQLSTPFQRVYFSDVANSYIENFQLADDIERLPDTRIKVAVGGRLNYYLNERFVVRTYYRYYTDDWGVDSHTASIEIPVKITDKFTLYPSYRFYNQGAADYFAPYEKHLSTEDYYTSDYDLSEFTAHKYGLGISYTDIFTTFHIYKFGLKSIDLKFDQYERDSGLDATIVALGFKFIMD